MYGIPKPNIKPDGHWFQNVYDWVVSKVGVVTVTDDYTITVSDFYVRADATSGALTVTLPAALNKTGREVIIKKIDSGANAVTIGITGSDTIEGSSSMSLASQWDKQRLISNGNASWEKI